MTASSFVRAARFPLLALLLLCAAVAVAVVDNPATKVVCRKVPVKPKKPGPTPKSRAVDCRKLPLSKEVAKGGWDSAAIKQIQRCLQGKGYYDACIDGLAGPLTLAGLDRAAAAAAGGGTGTAGSGASLADYPAYQLTEADLQELKSRNKVVQKLNELRDEEFGNRSELVTAVKAAIQEVAPQSAFLPVVLQQTEGLPNYQLTPPYFEALQNARMPDQVMLPLLEMKGQQFTSKAEMQKALGDKLQEADLSDYYQQQIMRDAGQMGTVTLPEQFFDKVEKLTVPDPVLKKLQPLVNVEYPNKHLFENALENRLDYISFKSYGPMITGKAMKTETFIPNKKIDWEGTSQGCCGNANGKEIYAFYPFWEPKQKQSIDFSITTRIGYFAVAFDDAGNITERFDWEKKWAGFINKAHQYETRVDLVVYKKDWQPPRPPEDEALINELSGSIVAAVDQKLNDTFLNRIKPIITLGRRKVPTMGDGVTLYLDGYPDDPASSEFLRKFLHALRSRLDAGGGGRYLNLLLPYDAVRKEKERSDDSKELVYFSDDVNLYLVFLEQPTSARKKELRGWVESMFKGEQRVQMLRKVIPVISSAGHEGDGAQQFKDDVVYFEDNFGGIGLWPLPAETAGEKAADGEPPLVQSEIREVFFNPANQGLLSRYSPSLNGLVGPHRWAFRIAFDLLLVASIVYLAFSIWLFGLQEFFRRHLIWFALLVLLMLCLLVLDPFWNDGNKIVGLALGLLLAVIVGVSLWFFRKLKRADLP